MPARSVKQRNLMAAAEHGANFPAAKKIRASMTHGQMHDYAATTNAQMHPHSMLARHPHSPLANLKKRG